MRPLRVGRRQRGQAARASDRRARTTTARWLRSRAATRVGTLIPISLDPNVSIHESKTLTCTIRPGRRPAHRRGRRRLRRSRRRTRCAGPAGGRVDERDTGAATTQKATTGGISTVTSRPAFLPIRRSASAARPARSRASSGTSCPRTASSSPATPTTTPANSRARRGATSRSSSRCRVDEGGAARPRG